MPECLALSLVRNRTRFSDTEADDDIVVDFIEEAKVCFELETELSYDDTSLLHRGIVADLASYNLLSSFLTLAGGNSGNTEKVTIGPATVEAGDSPAVLIYRSGSRYRDSAKRKMQMLVDQARLANGIPLGKSTMRDTVRLRYVTALNKLYYSRNTNSNVSAFARDFSGCDPDRLCAESACCDCGLVLVSCTC